MSDDPQRLLDDEATSGILRRDLTNARAADPDYDVAAGVARFEASLAVAPASEAPSVDAIAATRPGVSWWILGGGAVAAAVLAWSIGRDRDSAPTVARREAPAVALPREASPAPAAVPEEPPARVEPRDVAGPTAVPVDPRESEPRESEPAIARKRSGVKSPAAVEPASDDDALAREMAATAAAKRALATDPARALELVADANREFKASVYAEDREGIAVLALAKLGRNDQARARGEAYLAAHPKGSYADRIRSVIGEPETTEKKP